MPYTPWGLRLGAGRLLILVYNGNILNDVFLSILELPDALAQSLAHVRQLARPENYQGNNQYQNKLCNTNATEHKISPFKNNFTALYS